MTSTFVARAKLLTASEPKLTSQEKQKAQKIIRDLAKEIDSGTSLTMADLTSESASLLRRFCKETGKDLPIPDLDDF